MHLLPLQCRARSSCCAAGTVAHECPNFTRADELHSVCVERRWRHRRCAGPSDARIRIVTRQWGDRTPGGLPAPYAHEISAVDKPGKEGRCYSPGFGEITI